MFVVKVSTDDGAVFVVKVSTDDGIVFIVKVSTDDGAVFVVKVSTDDGERDVLTFLENKEPIINDWWALLPYGISA